MKTIAILPSSLIIQEYTRLQCRLNCLNYNRNPMCPPACPEISWFKNLIKSYTHAILCHEVINFDDSFKLREHQRVFQRKLLAEEHALKREGHFFSVCFFSGACSMCDENLCRQTECNRPSVGRVPICGTGINIVELCRKNLNFTQDVYASYWKTLLTTEYSKKTDNRHLCLGLILY